VHPVLEGIIKHNRIAPAYLFVGPPSLLKRQEAQLFIERLGCSKFDQLVVCPDGSSIKIEQIRQLQKFVSYGPSQSNYLAVLVEGADRLTPEAAAAFLKTLEEPPPNVFFLLLVEREDRLPSTIISRCQKIIFGEKYHEIQFSSEAEELYRKFETWLGEPFSIPRALEWASRLGKEREEVAELLYALAYLVKERLGKFKIAKLLLEAVKNLKKNASVKLTLEVTFLKMGEVWRTN
jgi:DNA polymerase III delta prime subunit